MVVSNIFLSPLLGEDSHFDSYFSTKSKKRSKRKRGKDKMEMAWLMVGTSSIKGGKYYGWDGFPQERTVGEPGCK